MLFQSQAIKKMMYFQKPFEITILKANKIIQHLSKIICEFKIVNLISKVIVISEVE